MNSTESKVRVIAGYWEPIAHYQRLGYWFIDDEAEHARHYTQEMVDKLKDYQVTTVAWPGYKGLGLKHEQVEFDRLKPFRKMLERAGIELGVYLQCGSYWAETFYEENPQAREWTALDYWGKPQSYSEYYRCYYRHRPCLTHRAFSDFVGGVAHMLVKDYGVSYFLADNNAQMPCYTPHFEKAFHAFLKEKYATHTPEGLRLFRRRYGHEHVDNIVLPSGSARRPIDAMPGLNDPGMQDWVEFRCILTARNARIISEAAKAANPAVKLCFNISYDYGEFGQLIWGTEAELMTDFADELMSEDSNYPRVEADGRLISHVHTCKHLRALGRPGVFHPPHPEQTEAGRNLLALSLMELAIHNQASLGTVYEFTFEKWDPDPRPATIQLIQKYADIFTDNDAVSEIAVLRSRRSSTNNWSEATQGRLLRSRLFSRLAGNGTTSWRVRSTTSIPIACWFCLKPFRCPTTPCARLPITSGAAAVFWRWEKRFPATSMGSGGRPRQMRCWKANGTMPSNRSVPAVSPPPFWPRGSVWKTAMPTGSSHFPN